MRFKRVDKSTVRCIVSQDEIEERGLKIEDLIKNGDKAQEFLNEVVDMAEEEIGFKMTSGIQAVQAAFLPNHDIVFTFSDKAENIGMDRALDHLKDMMEEEGLLDTDRIEEIREMTGQSQADAFSVLLEELREKRAGDGQKTEHAEEKKNAGISAPVVDDRMFTVFFQSVDYAVRFCKRFMGFQFRKESFYKSGMEYVLILDTTEIGREEMAALCLQASEYAKTFLFGDSRAREIEEHGECILPERALYHLQQL